MLMENIPVVGLPGSDILGLDFCINSVKEEEWSGMDSAVISTPSTTFKMESMDMTAAQIPSILHAKKRRDRLKNGIEKVTMYILLRRWLFH